ncbi:DNA polymerase III subunit epsilon [Paenibacillus swuensis]|uniref:DNA polymerase III subunit epsilon n=1 Tax=Paenibacillus swuensis TaxID=1178515 RepID=A0A172TN87_9BACL|nr:exonuclease domain-containing protein [Paenibacillus swuensis]ANE48287.1 DNA polymerase III subunit epsilon [Paenibacillus swuensis]
MSDEKRTGRLWNLYKMGGIAPAITSMFDPRNAQQMAFIRSMMKEQRKNTLFDMPLKELEIVVFDLETTGFYPNNGDEIISFGGVVVKGHQIQENETFYSIVKPTRQIPEHIELLTGITNDMVENAPDLLTVLHNFMEFIDKKMLVAHASGHDKQFLNAALWKTSKVYLTHRLLDTMMIAKWIDPKRPSYGLDELLECYNIPVTTRHHALEDSLMTAKLWACFMEIIETRQVVTLGDLYAYLSRH